MDLATQIIFFSLSAMAIASAIAVVTRRNLFHAAMFLGYLMLVMAGFYFLLNADLVGMMQVFVYVGGVVVVLLFGIMLTAQVTNVRLVSGFKFKGFTLLSIIGLVALLISVFNKATLQVSNAAVPKDSVSLAGKLFMTNYILPFEVISVLLLAALIGAIVIARDEAKHKEDR